MGFYFQDDFWEAADTLPPAQRDKCVAAIATYYFTQQEQELTGAALGIFIALKSRIDMARSRAKAGKSNQQSKLNQNDEQNEIKTAIKTKSNQQSKLNQNDEQNEIKTAIKTKSNQQSKLNQNDEQNEIKTAIKTKSNQQSKLNQNEVSSIKEGEGEGDRDLKEEKKGEKETTPIPFSEIVGYLNERTGQNFRQSSEATMKCIRARVADGFDLDDFKAVIDAKADEWLNDPEMAGYLRPSTLFGTKFEGYLNAAPNIARAKRAGNQDGGRFSYADDVGW